MSQVELMGMPLPVVLASMAVVVLIAVLARVVLSLRRPAPVRQGLYLAWDARRGALVPVEHSPFRLSRLSIEPIEARDRRH